jgi:hypothetical protein
MNRDQVVRALKAHEQEFRAAGVVSVSLFGFQKEIDRNRALAF